MGYYSTTVVAIPKEVLLTQLITNKIPKLLQETKHIDTNKVRFWVFEFIKWYDSFSEINEVMHFLRILDEENLEYGFIRIGEEEPDTEILGDPWALDMYTQRSINTPVGVYT